MLAYEVLKDVPLNAGSLDRENNVIDRSVGVPSSDQGYSLKFIDQKE